MGSARWFPRVFYSATYRGLRRQNLEKTIAFSLDLVEVQCSQSHQAYNGSILQYYISGCMKC